MGYFFIRSLEYADKVGYTKRGIEYAFFECLGENSVADILTLVRRQRAIEPNYRR